MYVYIYLYPHISPLFSQSLFRALIQSRQSRSVDFDGSSRLLCRSLFPKAISPKGRRFKVHRKKAICQNKVWQVSQCSSAVKRCLLSSIATVRSVCHSAFSSQQCGLFATVRFHCTSAICLPQCVFITTVWFVCHSAFSLQQCDVLSRFVCHSGFSLQQCVLIATVQYIYVAVSIESHVVHDQEQKFLENENIFFKWTYIGYPGGKAHFSEICSQAQK
jgi:hypothetical protein